jgi:hypothetical protein
MGLVHFSYGQQKCGFDDFVNNNPVLKSDLIKHTEEFKAYQKQNNLRRLYTYNYDTTYVIKVVFHVLYNTPQQNIPDSCIMTQMDVLNEDFNRTNPDTINTRDIFKPVAGKLKFKFVLAGKDPNGNPHSGIVRKTTSISVFSQTSGGDYDSRMKFNTQGGSDAWNTDEYLNIWVCNMFTPQSGLLGYATPPTGAVNWPSNVQFSKAQQGASVHYYTVGRYNPNATANGSNSLGRTCTHELGHYFGLFHTWGLRSNTCNVATDDFLEDTPNTSSPNSGCNSNRNSCQWNEPGDLPDMVENYMDYTRGSCQNTFTEDQAAMMLFNMKTYRPTLYELELEQDSTFVGNIAIKPVLLSNPGNRLIIGADNYSNTIFSVSIFNNIGQTIIKDKDIVLDKPFEFIASSFYNYGHYIVRVTNQTTGEEEILKWSNASLF